jgi:hypothetical protein
MHELGHVLGFVSCLDEIDDKNVAKQLRVFPLDLYRFDNDYKPEDTASFSEQTRSLVPDKEKHHFCNLVINEELSTGMIGDGYQASHWKTRCGVMISNIKPNENLEITSSDVDAMVSIGYGTVKGTLV